MSPEEILANLEEIAAWLTEIAGAVSVTVYNLTRVNGGACSP